MNVLEKVLEKSFYILPPATVVFLLYFIIFVGCTDVDGAKRVLRQHGYTEIEITGWRPLMAGEDTFSTGFSAKSPSGEYITGAVTRRFFKGSTIRLD